jgi:hypothetical protein
MLLKLTGKIGRRLISAGPYPCPRLGKNFATVLVLGYTDRKSVV